MRARPSLRRPLLLALAVSTSVLAACAGVLGLDEVTVADDAGAGRDASIDVNEHLDATTADGDVASPDGGDASPADADAGADAIADAGPDVGPVCGDVRFYPADLTDSGCVESVTGGGGTISPYTLPDGTAALLLDVPAGGTAGFAFTMPVVRMNGGTVVACNLYGNLVGATAPVPVTLIGQLTPVGVDGGAPYASVYMHDQAVGISPTDTSILASGLDDGTFNFQLSILQDGGVGSYSSYATFQIDLGDFHLTNTGGASKYVRYFFGVQSQGAIQMAVTEIGCTD